MINDLEHNEMSDLGTTLPWGSPICILLCDLLCVLQIDQKFKCCNDPSSISDTMIIGFDILTHINSSQS